MSLFADKWISPFNSNPFGLDDFHTTSFGEFRLGSNSSLFGKNLKQEEDIHPLKMKLRNGSVLTERGFYDHFDSIFHDRSRRYDLRAAASESARRSAQTTDRGKEYIIPIKIVTSPKGEDQASKNPGTDSTASTASNIPTGDSSGRVVEIPIVRECTSQHSKTRRDKSRSPILPQSSKVPTSSFKLLTPTTEENRNSQKRDSSSDVVLDGDYFFIKSQTDPRERSTKPESDIEVVEIEDEDSYIKSLRRKPLHHFQRTSSISSQESAKHTAESVKKLTSSKDVRRSGSEQEKNSKRSVCSQPGPTVTTAPPSYPIYDYLKPKLEAQDRQIDYIRGDGNCFFRAISKDVYGSEDYHAECRQAVCDLMQSHPDVFRQYIDNSSVTSHVIDMRVLGTWATTCEIYAAATLLGREVYILAPSPSSNTEYHWLLFAPRSLAGPAIGRRSSLREKEGDPEPCYVTLCHTNANHYDRIVPISAHCNCQLAPPSLNGVSMVLDLTTSEQDEVFRKE